MPLDRFITCICDDDLGALIKEGPVPPVMQCRKALDEAPEPQKIEFLERALSRAQSEINPGMSEYDFHMTEERISRLSFELDEQTTALSLKIADLDQAEAELAHIIGDHWQTLFLEYMDRSADGRARYKFSLKKDITLLSARLDQVDACIFALQIMHVPELVDHLHQMDEEYQAFELDPRNLDQYFRDLNGIKSRSREIRIDLELKTLELKELEESEAKAPQKRATRHSFVNVLSRIATWRKVSVIHTSELSVAEFVAMFNEYLDFINALERQQRQNKSKNG